MSGPVLCCKPCLLIGLAGVLAGGLWLSTWSPVRAVALETRAIEATQAALSKEGHSWARLAIADGRARLIGTAPDATARQQALRRARELMGPMIGLPGIVAGLDDAEGRAIPAASPPPAVPTATPASATAAGGEAQTSGSFSADDCEQGFAALLEHESITFASRGADIDASSQGLLDRLAKLARHCGAWRIVVEGHTDTRGRESDNLELSQRRADAVAQALSARGVPPERLRARGIGEARPLDTRGTSDAHGRNRRIEFHMEAR